jgi:retron-type reverse transcriptase
VTEGKRKVHSLTGRITPKLVFEAWRAVRRNRGAAGIDKISIQMFEKNLDANLDRLLRGLKQRIYKPLPARRVYISKDAKGTKFRPLGIPTVSANCTCLQRVFGFSDHHPSLSPATDAAVPNS